MDAKRMDMLLENYAAKLPEGNLPESVQSLWDAAAECTAAFDLAAENLPEMLHAAFDKAQGIINYAGSVQPLNGLFLLAEQKPEALRQALQALLTGQADNPAARQSHMQRFAADCNTLLAECEGAKRSYEQSLRSAMALTAILHPAENFLYKTTDARYLADMLGCQADVSSGVNFSLSGYEEMCSAIAQEIGAHSVLSALIPNDHPIPAEGLRRLMTYDMLLSAGPKRLDLFAGEEPLIRSRSRAGQANQERALQISQLEREIASVQKRIAAIDQEIASMPEPKLAGMRCQSRAFGDATILRTEGQRLLITAGGAERRMVTPSCFLQGHLIPEDESAAAYYQQLRQLREAQHALEGEVINLQGQINRLKIKS